MNNIEVIIEMIKKYKMDPGPGWAATIEEIASEYAEKFKMVIFSQHKSMLEETLKLEASKKPSRVRFDESDKKWRVVEKEEKKTKNTEESLESKTDVIIESI